MANNSMMLVCKICNPEDQWYFDRIPKPIFRLAKYYPTGAFYVGYVGTSQENQFAKDLNAWLLSHEHEEIDYDVMIGPTWIQLEYESLGWPVKESNP